jgi:thioester reductase-like protein
LFAGVQEKYLFVTGDVSLLNLGMSEDDYTYLVYEVDSIIHAAATVNLVHPYHALHNSNVLGTDNIIKFAVDRKIKPVHHIR